MPVPKEARSEPGSTPFSDRGAEDKAMPVLRVAVGLLFLWAYLDKLFGLGYATPSAWWADRLFMRALAGVGAAALLGVGLRVAAGRTRGLGWVWGARELVRRHGWLA